jgi:hypothetical protein
MFSTVVETNKTQFVLSTTVVALMTLLPIVLYTAHCKRNEGIEISFFFFFHHISIWKASSLEMTILPSPRVPPGYDDDVCVIRVSCVYTYRNPESMKNVFRPKCVRVSARVLYKCSDITYKWISRVVHNMATGTKDKCQLWIHDKVRKTRQRTTDWKLYVNTRAHTRERTHSNTHTHTHTHTRTCTCGITTK